MSVIRVGINFVKETKIWAVNGLRIALKQALVGTQWWGGGAVVAGREKTRRRGLGFFFKTRVQKTSIASKVKKNVLTYMWEDEKTRKSEKASPTAQQLIPSQYSTFCGRSC